MKKQTFFKQIALCLLSCLILCSCARTDGQKKQFTAHSFDYFDTVITIIGYEDCKEDFDEVTSFIFSEFEEYHRLYTVYHRYDGIENLCTINELSDGSHRTVKADKRIIDMLLFSKEMFKLTNGTVNIAMGSVLSLWHDYRILGTDDPNNASLPPKKLLEEASLHTNIDDMIIDEDALTVNLADPQMKLDVGAIAKGYAAERVALALEERKITGYVLNVGGNVRTVGTKPDGTSWSVALEDPNGGDYLEYLSLSGQSLVTSGSYQRFYYVDGKAYHHIIHPDTLMPAEGFLSVSVICNDSGVGDALSTALFCMPQDEGLELIESLPDTEAMWMTNDGVKTVSSGWDSFVK